MSHRSSQAAPASGAAPVSGIPIRHTAQSYLAAAATSAVLVGAAVAAFVLLASLSTFRDWPVPVMGGADQSGPTVAPGPPVAAQAAASALAPATGFVASNAPVGPPLTATDVAGPPGPIGVPATGEPSPDGQLSIPGPAGPVIGDVRTGPQTLPAISTTITTGNEHAPAAPLSDTGKSDHGHGVAAGRATDAPPGKALGHYKSPGAGNGNAYGNGGGKGPVGKGPVGKDAVGGGVAHGASGPPGLNGAHKH